MMLLIFWTAQGVFEIAPVSAFLITSFFLNESCDRIDELAKKTRSLTSDHFCYAMSKPFLGSIIADKRKLTAAKFPKLA